MYMLLQVYMFSCISSKKLDLNKQQMDNKAMTCNPVFSFFHLPLLINTHHSLSKLIKLMSQLAHAQSLRNLFFCLSLGFYLLRCGFCLLIIKLQLLSHLLPQYRSHTTVTFTSPDWRLQFEVAKLCPPMTLGSGNVLFGVFLGHWILVSVRNIKSFHISN